MINFYSNHSINQIMNTEKNFINRSIGLTSKQHLCKIKNYEYYILRDNWYPTKNIDNLRRNGENGSYNMNKEIKTLDKKMTTWLTQKNWENHHKKINQNKKKKINNTLL